jgi:transcriptional regulator with XRE-family HTH domain
VPDGSRDLDRFGREIRDRRRELRLSIRALAQRAGVSPAYISAIEAARNPSTGRPPVPSVHVVTRLAAALELDVQRLIRAVGGGPHPPVEHVLLYCVDAPHQSLLPAIDRLFGETVDHWLYIADPRHPEGKLPNQRATICRWSLGAYPYSTTRLDPAALVDALEREVSGLAEAHSGRRVGLVIADCSAVMRYVQNAAVEVELEHTWHEHVRRIWTRHLHGPPAIDICAYRHDDIDALGVTIDQLATALDLVTNHEQVIVLTGNDDVTTGAPAIRRILQHARPPGIGTTAWHDLTDAASEALAGRASH